MDSLYCEMIITNQPTLSSVRSTKMSEKFSGPLFLKITHARDHLQFLNFLGPVDRLRSNIYFRNDSTRVDLKVLTIDVA